MRYMKKYTSLTLLTLLVMLAGACSKDTSVESRAESANITVNIASRGQVDTDNNEGIKTLRLIMVQEGKVTGNWLREYNDNSLKQTFRIMGVKAVDTQLYAIVNEKGVNLDYATKFPVGSPFIPQTYNGVALATIDVATNGIPMEGNTQITVEQMSKETPVSIFVTRALARIDLNINNQSGGNLTVNSINFGAFFPDKGGLVNNPSDIAYSPKSFNSLNESIDAGKAQTFTYYLFASDAPDNAYTVGMTGSTSYEAKPIIDNSTNVQLTSIPRNTVLKINATVASSAYDCRLLCEILPWGTVELKPGFQ